MGVWGCAYSSMADLRFRRQILNLRDNWRCKDLSRHSPNYGTRGLIRNLNCRSPLPCNSFHAGISPAEFSPHHSQNLSFFQQRSSKAVSVRILHIHMPLCAHRAAETPPSIWGSKFQEKKNPKKQTTPTQPGIVPTAKLMSNNYCKVSLSREKMVLRFLGKKNVLAFWKAH